MLLKRNVMPQSMPDIQNNRILLVKRFERTRRDLIKKKLKRYFFCIDIIKFLGLTISVKRDGLLAAPKPFSSPFPFPFSHLSTLRALSSHQHLLELQVGQSIN